MQRIFYIEVEKKYKWGSWKHTLYYFGACSIWIVEDVGRGSYGVHLRTKITENKRQFEVQKLDYPCRNLVIWIWNRNVRSRNSIIRTWSYFKQVETIKGKLDIADVEVQITIPTKMQITWFELQFTFSTLISHLIVNNATIIFHKIPNETFNLNLKSRHIFEFKKPKFQFERKRK